MKRYLALLLIGAILAATLGVLSGCGGDTARAKSYMQKADATFEQVKTDSNELASKITAAFGDITDPAKFKAAVDDLNTFLDGIDQKADAARAEYEKIKPLKGVPDYVTYADMQIELIGLIKEATAQLKSVMSQIQTAATAGDQAKLDSIQQSFEPSFNALSDKITKLEEQANKFKSDKNL